MNKRKILTTILLLVPVCSFAARPFAVDDAGIVQQNGYEIEISTNYGKNYLDGFVEVKHAPTNRLDIGTNWGYLMMPRGESQLSPIGISFKYGLLPDMISMSLSAAFNSPVWNINFIFSRQLTKIFSVHTNIGMEGESFSNAGLLTYGILTTFQFANITTGIEMLGTHKEIKEWRVGANLKVTNWFTFDAGISGTFNNIELSATTGLWFGF